MFFFSYVLYDLQLSDYKNKYETNLIFTHRYKTKYAGAHEPFKI